MDKYRHEFKYVISDVEARLIEQRISKILLRDAHVNDTGIYNISSLYFDNIFNDCLFENISGTDPREKYRIRIYNHKTEKISLECKRKERGKTLKTSCNLSVDLVNKIIDGNLKLENNMPSLLKRFIIMHNEEMLRPKIIVEYDRIPYIYEIGNVRITFDKNLSSSGDISDFLTGSKHKRPVMPAGKQLLEVKFDELLPDYIYQALQIGNLTQTAYSKYYLCRKFCC